MISAYPQNGLSGNGWFGQQTPFPQAPTQQTGGIDGVAFVQGENSALAYVVPNGKTFLLIDTVEDRIYFKSADIYGRPSPLNDFWLTKDKPEPKAEAAKEKPAEPEWVTRKDFDDLKAQVEALAAKKSPGRPRKDETEDE